MCTYACVCLCVSVCKCLYYVAACMSVRLYVCVCLCICVRVSVLELTTIECNYAKLCKQLNKLTLSRKYFINLQSLFALYITLPCQHKDLRWFLVTHVTFLVQLMSHVYSHG